MSRLSDYCQGCYSWDSDGWAMDGGDWSYNCGTPHPDWHVGETHRSSECKRRESLLEAAGIKNYAEFLRYIERLPYYLPIIKEIEALERIKQSRHV